MKIRQEEISLRIPGRYMQYMKIVAYYGGDGCRRIRV